MIVKCPQCATGYSIPENLVTDQPKKMRCSRCKHIFTLMRRQEKAPSGYEEFTGSQQLPTEFAFLRTAAPEVDPQASAQAPPRDSAPAVEQPPEEGAAAEEMEVSDEDLAGGGAEDAAQAAPAEQPQAPPPPAAPPVSAGYYAGRQGIARQEVAPAPDQWEQDAPLELAGYTIPMETRSPGAQAFGKLVFVAVALLVLLLGFVLFRNGWSLSLSELDAQISYAFTGERGDSISQEARGTDVVVSARRLLAAASGEKYLVVTGDVFNRGFTGLSRIVLRGRLVSRVTQETVSEARAPCGKTIDDETIKATPKGVMAGHYRSKTGELYNCVISVDGSSAFQLVFDGVPADWEKVATMEITTVAAQIAE